MVLALACPVIPVSGSSVRLASLEAGEFSSSSEAEAGSLEGSRSASVSPGLGSASSSEEPDAKTTHARHGRVKTRSF